MGKILNLELKVFRCLKERDIIRVTHQLFSEIGSQREINESTDSKLDLYYSQSNQHSERTSSHVVSQRGIKEFIQGWNLEREQLSRSEYSGVTVK